MMVIESLIACAPRECEPAFYRTSAGAEIDMVLVPPGTAPWAIEIKRSLSPRPDRGFHLACDDIGPRGALSTRVASAFRCLEAPRRSTS
jgi:hypothetical protein